MGRQDWDESGSGSERLRTQFNDVLDAYDEHRTALAHAHRRLAELRAEAASSDGAVRVTADSSGAVLEIVLEPAALRTTAESLAATLTAVAQAAARQAKAHCADILAPLGTVTDRVAELAELVPGVPSLRAEPPDHASAQ
jgi:DNA-binding protein YbaB